MRAKIGLVIFGTDTPAGRLFDLVLIYAILISVAAVVLDSVVSLHIRFGLWFTYIEWFFTLLFTVEYFLRIYISGTFARPKGVAVDSEGNAWVVDALFDNVQVFDGEGRLLLVIGGPGQTAGEFWSPAGIATRGREIYIADTFNNRIQVLRYIGGDQ